VERGRDEFLGLRCPVSEDKNVIYLVTLNDDLNLASALTIARQKRAQLRVPASFTGSDDPAKVALLRKAQASR
jgi:hypothetical protein